MGWRAWSQSLWDKYGSKLQKRYDQIDGMELPENVKNVFDSINAALPDKLVSGLMSYVVRLYRKNGKQAVIDLANKILKLFK